MKKRVCLLICIVTIICVPILSNGAISEKSKFSIGDVLEILKSLAGMTELTPSQNELYDFDGNGEVEISDVLELLKYLAGMESLVRDEVSAITTLPTTAATATLPTTAATATLPTTAATTTTEPVGKVIQYIKIHSESMPGAMFPVIVDGEYKYLLFEMGIMRSLDDLEKSGLRDVFFPQLIEDAFSKRTMVILIRVHSTYPSPISLKSLSKDENRIKANFSPTFYGTVDSISMNYLFLWVNREDVEDITQLDFNGSIIDFDEDGWATVLSN